jgi:hypothetical protein
MPNATPLPQHSHLAIILAPPSSEVRNQNNQLIYFNRAVQKMQGLFLLFLKKKRIGRKMGEARRPNAPLKPAKSGRGRTRKHKRGKKKKKRAATDAFPLVCSKNI